MSNLIVVAYPDEYRAAEVLAALRDRGHDVAPIGNVGGGMSAIQFEPDGSMTGAACWRADGTPIGLGGGYARESVRFRPEALALH